jgi:hypothetical protein
MAQRHVFKYKNFTRLTKIMENKGVVNNNIDHQMIAKELT